MNEQRHYVGLDVSLETTSICVIDDAGAIIWRGKCSSDPDAIAATVRQQAPSAVRVGLETGQLSNWLTLSLRRRGVPVVCMDARHAKAALSLQINKTDANDAFGLAQVVRTGSPRGRGQKYGCSYLTHAAGGPIPPGVAAPGNG
jgi:transposase